jgi:putative copper export protein
MFVRSMTVRSVILAAAAIATFTAASLSLADAATKGGAHGKGLSHTYESKIPPGVLPCKRGIVWVCQ